MKEIPIHYLFGSKPESQISIAASGTRTSGIEYVGDCDEIVLGFNLLFSATPNGNVKIEVFNVLDSKGVYVDTIAYRVLDVDYTNATRKQKSIVINTKACNYLQFKITSGDSSGATTCFAWFSKAEKV